MHEKKCNTSHPDFKSMRVRLERSTTQCAFCFETLSLVLGWNQSRDTSSSERTGVPHAAHPACMSFRLADSVRAARRKLSEVVAVC